jgi:hypothetical protein
VSIAIVLTRFAWSNSHEDAQYHYFKPERWLVVGTFDVLPPSGADPDSAGAIVITPDGINNAVEETFDEICMACQAQHVRDPRIEATDSKFEREQQRTQRDEGQAP